MKSCAWRMGDGWKAGVAMLCVAAALLAMCGCGGGEKGEAQQSVAELVQEGWTKYRLNEFHDAIRAFEAARAATEEGSAEWAMATYGLGITWDLQRPGEDPKKATALFNEVLEKAPEADVVPWVKLALVRQKHLVPVGQEPDYPEVVRGFEEIMREYPGHLAAKEAFLYVEGIRLSDLTAPSSRVAESNLLEFIAHEDKEFVAPAWSLLTVAYVNLDEQAERLHAEEESFKHTETDPNDPSVEYAWAFWNLATIAEFDVGDFAKARKYYQALIDTYPNDLRVHGCKAALDRMDRIEAKLRAELEDAAAAKADAEQLAADAAAGKAAAVPADGDGGDDLAVLPEAGEAAVAGQEVAQ
ncbi:MAG: tetratricopeptide repeat protein [Kiritimatiellae bacterium]|nr:tetratricopeptide repeat protein [Kiritimatiellia bacterium]